MNKNEKELERILAKATELQHLVSSSPDASENLKLDAKLLLTDCQLVDPALTEELELLNRRFDGIVKRAQRAGIIGEE